MREMRLLRLGIVAVSGAALATPPMPTLNVMLQFTCLSLSPPAYTGDTIGFLRPAPVVRSERAIGGGRASHRIEMSGDRHIAIEERLATAEECSRVSRDNISWILSRRGGRTAEFCISANGFIDTNVIVRIDVPALRTRYDREVAEALHLVSNCRIERGPYHLFPGDRLVVGRQLWVPRIEQ